jgi:hypothetical protein
MTASDVGALVVAVLAALSALVATLTALLQAYKVAVDLKDVKHQLNSRLDELIKEREDRIRNEFLLEAARSQAGPLPPPPAVGRADPIIRRVGPNDPERT